MSYNIIIFNIYMSFLTHTLAGSNRIYLAFYILRQQCCYLSTRGRYSITLTLHSIHSCSWCSYKRNILKVHIYKVRHHLMLYRITCVCIWPTEPAPNSLGLVPLGAFDQSQCVSADPVGALHSHSPPSQSLSFISPRSQQVVIFPFPFISTSPLSSSWKQLNSCSTSRVADDT